MSPEPTELPVDRILVIDDSPEDTALIEMSFETSGVEAEVEVIHDGRSALDALRSNADRRPGLVLLDLNMPGMDGLEVLTALRADAALTDLPVVILSTSDHRDDIRRAYERGANAYVTKPMSFEGLCAAARELHHFWFEVATRPALA